MTAPESGQAGSDRADRGIVDPDRADPDRMGTPPPLRERIRLDDARPGWWERRREKVVEEIARNRRGGHTVPTWVMVLALVVIVGAWAAVLVLA
jgi:hypothetical protein